MMLTQFFKVLFKQISCFRDLTCCLLCSAGSHFSSCPFPGYLLGVPASLFGSVARPAEGDTSCDAVHISVPAIFLG
jgi:hypothetical protein